MTLVLSAESRLRRFQRTALRFRRQKAWLLPAGLAAFLWVMLAATVLAAGADPVYVIEQLVVAVGSEPGQAGERVGQVKSGDKLELIDRQGDEAHIRLPSGKEGWVKGSYVSAEEPLTHRLTERTAEVDQLKQDVSRLQSELATARASHDPPPPAVPMPAPVTSPVPPPSVSSVNNTAQPMRDAVFLRSPDQTGQTPWEWVLGTAAVMLLAGFVLGWRTLDRRIRRKYGGLRIY
jgi:hypothetical protein